MSNLNSSSEEENLNSLLSEVEADCRFAKLSLNCEILPGDELPADYDKQIEAQRLEFAENQRRIGKNFKYSLFSTEGGVKVEETNQALRILDPRQEKGYYSTLIGITVRGEGPSALLSTVKSVLRGAGRRTLVIVVVDGLYEILDDPDFMKALSDMRLFSLTDIYTYKIAKDERYLSDKVYAFESRVKTLDKKIVYSEDADAVDIILAVKHEKKRKLHSFLWIFYGFGFRFDPQFIILLKAGTVPHEDAVGVLVQYMVAYPSTSAAAGEVQIQTKHTNPIVWAEWCEHKLSNALASTFESVCGFLSVIDSSFSIYRWEAFLEEDFRVLRSFFKPFENPDALSWVDVNVYFLAEDRVPCDYIVKLKTYTENGSCYEHGHYTRFVKQAKATVPAGGSVEALITERRASNNGSWFALIKVLYSSWRIFLSSHNFFSKLLLVIQLLMFVLSMAYKWLAIGIYFALFSLAFRAFSWNADIWIESIRALFIFLNFSVFIFSLAIDVKYISNKIWTLTGLLYITSFIFMLSVFVAYCILEGISIEGWIFIAILVVPILSLLVYCEDFTKWPLYIWTFLLALPVYINLLFIFSVSRTDDVSNPFDHEKFKSVKNGMFKQLKVLYVLVYVVSNIVFGLYLESTLINKDYQPIFYISAVFLGMLVVGFAGEIVYLITSLCFTFRKKRNYIYISNSVANG